MTERSTHSCIEQHQEQKQENHEQHVVLKTSKRFRELQGERVAVYQLFQQGYQEYMETAPVHDFNAYELVVKEVTGLFQTISSEINDLETALRCTNDPHAIAIADIIRLIQDCEKLKLQLTAKYQAAGKEFIDDESNDIHVVSAIKTRLANVVEDINGHLEELRYKEDYFIEHPEC